MTKEENRPHEEKGTALSCTSLLTPFLLLPRTPFTFHLFFSLLLLFTHNRSTATVWTPFTFQWPLNTAPSLHHYITTSLHHYITTLHHEHMCTGVQVQHTDLFLLMISFYDKPIPYPCLFPPHAYSLPIPSHRSSVYISIPIIALSC